MDLGLKGKAALVSASSRGIGFGVAKVLASEGCKVAISSSKRESIESAKAMIVKETGNREVHAVKCDLTSKQEIDQLIVSANERLGGVDILAYNTGPPRTGNFSELDDNDWNEGVKLLLLSAVRLAKGVIPRMIEKKWGRLVFITSDTLKQPIPNLVLSNTVRLSIAGLSKSLAFEYGPRGITSNGIMQGHILTDRQRQVGEDIAKRTGQSLAESMQQMLREVPLGRYGTTEEIGYLTAFLSSDRAGYINGAMIAIDGGLIRSVL